MRSVIACSILGAFTVVVACGVDVDVSNKACPCGTGYKCDPVKHICVLPADLTPASTATAPPKKVCADPCPCTAATASTDCTDPTRAVCSSTTKTCAECDPANDTCPAGSYCNSKSQCVLGCRASADCAKISPASPFCATDRHVCVACQGTTGCTGGQACTPSGTCAATCGGSQTCTGGQKCCGTFCVDTTSDPLNCGGCGTTCAGDNGTPKCTSSSCTTTCAGGFTHCGTGNSGCETDTRTDINNCGGCGNQCSKLLLNVTDPACASGACTFTTCAQGFYDGNGNPADGCDAKCGYKGETCCPGGNCLAGNSCNGGSCRSGGSRP